MPAGRPKRIHGVGDPTSLREERRADADLNRMLRAEIGSLIEKAKTYPAVRRRPGILRMIERGEYGAAGRMLLTLERAARDGDSAAAVAARDLNEAVEAIRLRAGDARMEAVPFFAPVLHEPPPHRGRPRSLNKNWSWVAEYGRRLSARTDVGEMTKFEGRTEVLTITAIRRIYQVRSSEFSYVASLFGVVVPTAKKALLQRRVALTGLRDGEEERFLRQAVQRAVRDRAHGQGIPAPVDAALSDYTDRVLRLLLRPTSVV